MSTLHDLSHQADTHQRKASATSSTESDDFLSLMEALRILNPVDDGTGSKQAKSIKAKKEVKTPKKAGSISKQSQGDTDTQSSISSVSANNAEILKEFSMLFDKDNESGSNSIQKPKLKKRSSIMRFFKRNPKNQQPTSELETLMGESTENINAAISDPEFQELLVKMKTLIDEQKLELAHKRKHHKSSIKSISSSLRQKFKSILQRYAPDKITEFESTNKDHEHEFTFHSVNTQLQEYQNELNRPSTQTLVDGSSRNSKFGKKEFRVVELIRNDKSLWNLMAKEYEFKESYLTPKELQVMASISTLNNGSKSATSMVSLHNSNTQRSSSKVKPASYAGINIDQILSSIYNDQNFKIACLYNPFPNHHRYPDLFGPITTDDIQSFINYPETAQIPPATLTSTSFSTDSSMDHLFNLHRPNIAHFHTIRFEDEEEAAHPLDRTNAEECDFYEMEHLIESFAKKQKQESNVPRGELELKALKDVMDKNPNLVRSRCNSTPIRSINAEKSRKVVSGSRSSVKLRRREASCVDQKSFIKSINVFRNDAMIDGFGAQELQEINE